MNSFNKNILFEPLIKVFVYGTLRKNQLLEFYMESSEYLGLYYTKGQLMKSENNNVYIDTAYNNAVTIGELYLVNFYCLQRINHLEVFSGTFPNGYELNVTQVWKLEEKGSYTFKDADKNLSFFYKWKNMPTKILTGDYNDDICPIDELQKLLTLSPTDPDTLVQTMQHKLSIYQNLNF